ncbi:MAG: GNAT family N-acetyltransferase [Eubacteriales bacterium]|nr:GNAT family N-acetyltransferase [Clostridiales bacterium]MDD7302599.1 GNAT family N-acetyltransferase [Eubacteriales bacterium]
MEFVRERVREYGDARVLKKSDYLLYEEFFRETSPAANPDGWLREYFEEKAAKEYFTGYFLNDRLVSVCDAPDMPYLEDVIQHTGIVTLRSERRKGYARRTAALAAHHLIVNGICPQWECRADNTASIALAEAVGYEKYGVAYILEE